MPVDRAFTVRGTGTVVTGTVWSGTLGRDDTVRIMSRQRDVSIATVLQAYTVLENRGLLEARPQSWRDPGPGRA